MKLFPVVRDWKVLTERELSISESSVKFEGEKDESWVLLSESTREVSE